jgi:hypothetical protein
VKKREQKMISTPRAQAAATNRRGAASLPRRPDVRARFLPSLLRELAASAAAARRAPAAAAEGSLPSAASAAGLDDRSYEQLLEKGRAATMDAPSGQLQGRAGRRCTLEDGERYLSRAAAARPADLRAHLLLLRNLMMQAMGREREVPGLALQALRQAAAAEAEGTVSDDEQEGAPAAAMEEAASDDGSRQQHQHHRPPSPRQQHLDECSSDLLDDPSCMPALQVVLLALKALHAQPPSREALAEAERATSAARKRGEDPEAAAEAAVDAWRARRLRAFVEAAGDVVPGLRGEFARVERRLRRQLAALGPPGGSSDARARALVSRAWLSAVDLAPPCGVVG